MKPIKICNTCKKHTSTLYASRCKRCYKEYQEAEAEMLRRAKGLSIRVFEKGGHRD